MKAPEERLYWRYEFLCESADSMYLFVDLSEDAAWHGVTHERLLELRRIIRGETAGARTASEAYETWIKHAGEIDRLMRELRDRMMEQRDA